MATTDLSRVQFWQPPLNPTSFKQHTASPHIRKNGRSGLAASSRTPPVSPHCRVDEIRRRSAQFKPAIAATRRQGCDSAFQHEDDAAGAQGCRTDFADRDVEAGDAAGDKADDDLLSIDELLAFSSMGNSEGYQNFEDTPQHLEARVSNTSGSYLDPIQSKSDESGDNSQGTREKLVTLEDNGPDTPELTSSAYEPTPQLAGKYKAERGNPLTSITAKVWDEYYNKASSSFYDPAKKNEKKLADEGKSKKELEDMKIRARDVCLVHRNSGATRAQAIAMLIKDEKLAAGFQDQDM
ncbi:hypothetical protein MMC18_007713 [Xylographa bjoerkii]|nr:hypothetical protein [Xylographa bjoerkii]